MSHLRSFRNRSPVTRKSFLWIWGIVILALGLPASASAQGRMSCTRTDVPGPVRTEAVTELLPDIVLSCTGGQPPAAGTTLPTFQFILSSTAPLSSRMLVPGAANNGSGLVETLLLVDEPVFTNQIACIPQLSGDSACPAVAGAAGNPNLFQGWQIQSNVIAFRAIPIAPPGSGKRTLRISNLRANIASLTAQSQPAQLQLNVQMYDSSGAAISLSNATLPLGTPQASTAFSMRTAGDLPLPLPGPAITLPPASVPVGTITAANSFQMKFQEGFAGAFRRRNVATSSATPLLTTVQATPGLDYHTETGMFNSLLPTSTYINQAGMADTGTRLRVQFINIPDDILLWVSVRDVQAGTTGYSAANAKALLTSADSNGLGALAPVLATSGLYAQLPVTNGTATATWEVVSTDPTVQEQISFSVGVTTKTGTPGQGTVTVVGSIAPLVVGSPTTLPIPGFHGTAEPVPAFAISNQIVVPSFQVVEAGAYQSAVAAPGAIVSAFGQGLASGVAVAEDPPFPSSLAGVSLTATDMRGYTGPAGLIYVSPAQINFVLDAGLAPGPALLNLWNSGTGQLLASGALTIAKVAPSLFSADSSGKGVAAGQAIRNHAGVNSIAYLADLTTRAPIPIDLSGGDIVFISLYGTGIRGAGSLADVQATVGGASVPVSYAGAQGSPGLDQVNLGPLPASLQGKGLIDVVLTVAGQAANTLQIATK